MCPCADCPELVRREGLCVLLHCGAQTRAKVEENCAAFSWNLTAEEMALLDQAVHTCLDD